MLCSAESTYQDVLRQDCFTLIDADGSGAIDVSELWQAFKLLNLRVSKAQVQSRQSPHVSLRMRW